MPHHRRHPISPIDRDLAATTSNDFAVTLDLAEDYVPNPIQEWQVLNSPNGISGDVASVPDGYSAEIRSGTELWLLRVPQGSLFMLK